MLCVIPAALLVFISSADVSIRRRSRSFSLSGSLAGDYLVFLLVVRFV